MNAVSPLFSIVTATYNSMKDLPALQSSLDSQTFSDFEWIVQDGASSDGTVEFLSSVSRPYLSYSSESDRGIYDAFNRSLERVHGRFVLFLGSDDYLATPTVLAELAAAISAASEEPAIVLGGARTGDSEIFESRLGLITLAINSVHHQGALYRRDIFDDFRYDLTVPVIADYELNVLLYKRRATVLQTGILVAECGAEGISQTSNEMALYKGMHQLRRRHVGWPTSFAFYLVGIANVARRGRSAGRASANA